MPEVDQALLSAIETSLFWVPEVPGKCDRLHFPGIQGRVTPLSHPLMNLVGAAELSPHDADAIIVRVFEHFQEQHKAFGWIIGPLSRPSDLAERLQRVGLERIEELAGMGLTDLDIPIESNPAVQVREIEPQRMRDLTEMQARAYDLPTDVTDLLAEIYQGREGEVSVRAYVAVVGDSEEPVAFSYMISKPDSEVVVLGGAATLPEHRGSGIYTAMVAHRLVDARAEGNRAAAIQAVRSTSAPICAKLGFQELGAMELWAWMPPDQAPVH